MIEMTSSDAQAAREGGGKRIAFSVDGREIETGKESLSGTEIMALAGVPPQEGLIIVLDDGTERAFGPGETIDARSGHRFKTPPRFKRG